MTYFYDADICFTRLSFPHMLSATNAPPGCGSIQAEVYFSSKYRPLTQSPNDLIDQVIADLRRRACGRVVWMRVLPLLAKRAQSTVETQGKGRST